MSGNKLVVYTSIFGGYDPIRDPLVYFPKEADYRIVTDSPVEDTSVWKRVTAPDYTDQDLLSNRMRSRLYKMHPHMIFPNADITIWHGGNIQLNASPQWMVDTWLGDADIVLFKHPHRTCVYEEAKVVLQLHKAGRLSVDALMALCRFNSYPENNRLAACRFMIRRNKRMQAFNEAWWDNLVSSETERDQLLFNYTLWRMDTDAIKVRYIPGDLLTSPHFKYHYH